MKEIIYIQAGPLANYTGTHFWNTQQCYFTYGEDQEVVVDHDVSFREGVSSNKEATYCPRLLVIDRKTNFGGLSQNSGLYDEAVDEHVVDPDIWQGSVDEVRQPAVSLSTYQEQLDEEFEEDPVRSRAQEEHQFVEQEAPVLRAKDVRYWSDYNRLYYLSRSLHRLPDALEFENLDQDWAAGKDMFERYNSDNSLMEDHFRLFVEECDAFQGISLTADSSTFGSFSVALLTALRDEFPRIPVLCFTVFGGNPPGQASIGDTFKTRGTINDARLLRVLHELDVTHVPIQKPTTWRLGPWSEGLDLHPDNHFEASAVLSAHIESSTLPLRLKQGRTDLADFCARLNIYGNTPFAELSGIFPAANLSASLEQKRYNFSRYGNSALLKNANDNWLFRYDVTRGLRGGDVDNDQFMMNSGSLPAISFPAPVEYPLPTSFPSFFRSTHLNNRSRRTSRGILTQSRSAPILSSLGLRKDGIPKLLEGYASFTEDCARHKIDWQALGLEQDEARELAVDIWTIRDNFGAVSDTLDEYGEDEEV